MKFLKLGDHLILTEKGQESSPEMTVTFTNLGTEVNKAIFYYDPKDGGNRSEKVQCALSDGSCNVSISDLVETSIATNRYYVVELYKDSEFVASGRFGMNRFTSFADPLAYNLEIQEVWRAIAYIANNLSVDEANIDKLVTGYVTE